MVSIKSCPNAWWIFGLKWKATRFMLNYCDYFLCNFGLLFNSISGHSECKEQLACKLHIEHRYNLSRKYVILQYSRLGWYGCSSPSSKQLLIFCNLWQDILKSSSNKKAFIGSGCCSAGRAVASNKGVHGSKPDTGKFFMNIYLLSTILKRR